MPQIATDRPLKDAVDMFSRKVPVGSSMSSREWELIQAEIRMQAMFSARVESERVLLAMKSRLEARIALAKKDGRTMDRGVFIEEMRAELAAAGYRRGDVKRGSVQDLKSTRRLGLIWDMNLAQAQGYARWKADMTPEGLENEPCYEFIRVMSRIEVRDWPVIWEQSGGEFFDGAGSNDDYPGAKGRMIAAKNDPIWKRISRFGTPWPPFDWGSGMGLRGVGRDEAERLGVIDPEDVVEAEDSPFSAVTSASLIGIPENRRKALVDSLAGEVEVRGDRLHMLPIEPQAQKFSLPKPPEPLQALATEAQDQVAAMTSKDLADAMVPIRNTVAHVRLDSAADAGGEKLRDRDTVGRAMLQFLAMGAGLAETIRQLRNEPVRDAWWCEMDFSGVADYFSDLLGGEA